MKISDSIVYSFKKLIRNKKNIFYSLVLTVTSLLLLFTLSFSRAFFKYIDSDSTNILDKRKILVSKRADVASDDFINKNIESIRKIEHIDEAIPDNSAYPVVVPELKNDNQSGDLFFIHGSEFMLPENVIGEKFTSNDTGVAICPIYMFTGDTSKITKDSKDILIDGHDLLGKSIEVIVQKGNSSETYNKNFKIIGLYDSEETHNFSDECYVPQNDIDDIVLNTRSDTVQVHYDDDGNPIINYVLIIVDDYANVNEVKRKLIDMNLRVENIYTDSDYRETIKYISIFVLILVILGTIIITNIYEKKNNLNNSYSMGILKSIGYTSKDIIIYNIIQTLFVSMFSYMLASIIFNIVLLVIQAVFKYRIIVFSISFLFKQSISTYIISMLIMVLLPCICSLIYSSKKIKNTSISIIKGDAK